jgi:uncharacterized protein YbbK (DUF523 family)
MRAASKKRTGKPGRTKPVVIVSKCLLGERCRYNGETVSAPAVLGLSNRVEIVPVCPETGIGLPIPRDPIRLVKTGTGIRLIQTRTGADLTATMHSFCGRFLTGLDVGGFILKARSPSCAVRDSVVYDDSGEVMEETRPGLFAAEVLDRFPGLPVEDDERLAEPSVMLRFAGRLFDIRQLPEPTREGDR